MDKTYDSQIKPHHGSVDDSITPLAVERTDVAHEKKASWQTVGVLQISDIVGTGILALGSGVALVGWIPAAILLVLFLPVNIYAGVILKECYQIFPVATNFPKMAKYAGKNKIFTMCTQFLYYSFMIGVLGQYVQVLSISLKSLFTNLEGTVCNYEFTLLAVVMLLPLIQLRTLNDSRAIQLVNTASITLVVVISVCFMWKHMADPVGANPELKIGEKVLVNTNADWIDVFSALSKFAFAYMGNYIFLEMIAEMENPKDFHKSFYISSPYQLFFYAIAAMTQYAYEGSEAGNNGFLYHTIPKNNPLYGACAFLLLVHMLAAYLVKGTIVARLIHVKLFPATVNDRGVKGTVHWFIITLVVALFAFLISSSIPSFGALMDFLGSFQVPLLAFALPPLFLFFCRKAVSKQLSCFERVALVGLILLSVVLTGVGLVSASIGISRSWAAGQSPFYC